MCGVPVNKELTTAHGSLVVYLILSGSGTRGARPHRPRKVFLFSQLQPFLHVPPIDVRDIFDVTDMITPHAVNFHDILVEAVVHVHTIHSRCSSDTVQDERHQRASMPSATGRQRAGTSHHHGPPRTTQTLSF